MTRIWALALAMVALSACRGEDAAPPPVEESADPMEDVAVAGPERRVLAFGDSLFAAYGLSDAEGYPARLERALRADGINARVIDAGVSGDTTSAGAGRIGYVLDEAGETPDLAIISLGGNDLLRGLSPQETRANLDRIMGTLTRRGVPILLYGLQAPPNLGSEYTAPFDAIYADLAEQYDAALVPFWLEPVASRADLVQDDRIHPTAEGIEVLVDYTADDVAAALRQGDS